MIGCLLDLDTGQMAFSLNGDLLQDSSGSSVTFEGVSGVPLVPAITLAAGQRAQLNFGRSEVSNKRTNNFKSVSTYMHVHVYMLKP